MPSTIAIYSDLACPWAFTAVHRLRRARDAHGLDVVFDPRAWPLEWVNERATPRHVVEPETAVLAQHEPDLFSNARQRARQLRLAKALADIDFALPGSVEVRRTRCGTAGCACKARPPQLHGPYAVWTRKVAAKTVTKVLSEDQLRDYQRWLDNARKLRTLTRELHALTLESSRTTHDPDAPDRACHRQPQTPWNHSSRKARITRKH